MKKNSRLLPQTAIELMTKWYEANYTNPYPTYTDSEEMATNGNISLSQVKQWFVNTRRRTQNQYRKKRSSYNLVKRSKQTDHSALSSSTESQINNQQDWNSFDLNFNENGISRNQTNYGFLQSHNSYNQNANYTKHSTPIYQHYSKYSADSISSPESSSSILTAVSPSYNWSNCSSNIYHIS